MTQRWRVNSIAAFSTLNLTRRPRSTTSLVLAFALLAVGLLLLEALSWQGAGDRMSSAIRDGARVWVVEDQPGQLPARRCDAMRYHDGVETAFAVVDEPGRATANGHMLVPLVWVTSGALAYFHTAPTPQVLVGSDLSRLVESDSGRVGSVDLEPVVSSVVPTHMAVRQGFLSSSVMALTVLDQARYCIIEFSLESDSLIRSELAQIFSRRSGAAVDIRRLNSEFLSYDTAARQRSQRSSKFGWVIGSPMSAALVLLMLRLRRSDLAVMMLLGANRSEICLALALQTTIVIWAGLAAAIGVAAAASPLLGVSLSALALGAIQALATMAVATIAGLAAAWRAGRTLLAADAFKSHD